MRPRSWQSSLPLAALAIVVPNTNSFVILLVTRALAFSILVMSLDILLGFTGLASLGQAAYLGDRRLCDRDPGDEIPVRAGV